MSEPTTQTHLELIPLELENPKSLSTLWLDYIGNLRSLTGRVLSATEYEKYLNDPKRSAMQIGVDGKAVGFILINEICHFPENRKNLAEFYIDKSCRRQGYGKLAALSLLRTFPCRWEISVLPRNISALNFWQQTIREHYGIDFLESVEHVEFDLICPQRWIFQIDSSIERNEGLALYPPTA